MVGESGARYEQHIGAIDRQEQDKTQDATACKSEEGMRNGGGVLRDLAARLL